MMSLLIARSPNDVSVAKLTNKVSALALKPFFIYLNNTARGPSSGIIVFIIRKPARTARVSACVLGEHYSPLSRKSFNSLRVVTFLFFSTPMMRISADMIAMMTIMIPQHKVKRTNFVLGALPHRPKPRRNASTARHGYIVRSIAFTVFS